MSTQPVPLVRAPIGIPPLPARLMGRLRTTPGRLEAALVLLVVGCGIFWAVAAWVFSDLGNAVRTVGRDTVPSIVAAEKINVALADINANLANAILAKDDDTKPSWRTIKEDSDAIAHALITASENVTYGVEEEGPIATMMSDLPVYFRLLGQARGRMQGDPLPDARAAFDLMQKTILPAAFALDDANFRHLTATYDLHRANQFVAVATLLLGLGALGAVLIGIQLGLTRLTRRIINLPLLAATVMLGICALYLFFAVVNANSTLRAAKQDSFDSVHALWKARAVATDANAEESLYLLERGTPLQQAHDEAFFRKSALVLSGLTPEEAVAQATAGRYQGIKGFIGAELNNITYPGEREAALDMLRTFAAYLGIDRQLRDLERGGHHAEAFALDVGTAPGQSDWAFERFDKALGRTLDINQRYFTGQIDSAFSLLAWARWVIPGVALAIAALSWFGLRPRISEYRM
jgi:hypothetical protein